MRAASSSNMSSNNSGGGWKFLDGTPLAWKTGGDADQDDYVDTRSISGALKAKARRAPGMM